MARESIWRELEPVKLVRERGVSVARKLEFPG